MAEDLLNVFRSRKAAETSEVRRNHHVTVVEMRVETALFFESVEEVYKRVFHLIKPKTKVPVVTIRFRKYANANSRIRLKDGSLTVDVSDLLANAPAPIQEALAFILICKLFVKKPDASLVQRYRRYLNRADVRRELHRLKQERGRKVVLAPQGKAYDLCALFEELNLRYFHGLMTRPQLGWSIRSSRRTLGHYDPSHNMIVLTRILDSSDVPVVAVKYVMYHEMLHLRFPTEHKGARRCIHTQSFKAAEREFEDYQGAKRQLASFLERRP